MKIIELKKLLAAAAAAAVLFSLVSCRGSKEEIYAEESVAYDSYYAEPMMMTASAPSPVATSSKRAVAAAEYSDNLSFTTAETGAGYEESERKLVKSGNLSLEVSSIESADTYVSAWAEQFGGYVFSSGCNTSNAWYTVKIPASRFEEAMNTAGDMGTVKSKNVYTEDVSDTWYDLDGRLSTRKIMLERLNEYLKTASSIDELIRIESEINSVTSDIEYMEGRMKRLNGTIEYSTINLDLSLPYRIDDDGGFQWPDLGEDLMFFASDVVDFFAEFFVAILYIFVFGIPILGAVVFFYWLLLGKVGLLVRIFRKVGRSWKTEKKEAEQD